MNSRIRGSLEFGGGGGLQRNSTSRLSLMENAAGGSAEGTNGNGNAAKSENVSVVVRVRPLTQAELEAHQLSIWTTLPETQTIALSTEFAERARKAPLSFAYGTATGKPMSASLYSARTNSPATG